MYLPRIEALFLLCIYSFSFVHCATNNNKNRTASFPYITGDGFRSICNFIFDETQTFDATTVKKSSIIFVKTDLLVDFFKNIHPKIKKPYVLVTHNADHSAPGEFEQYLNDPNIIHWFGQNPSIIHHAKFTPIPIGLANSYWEHGNVKIINSACARTYNRNILLYINLSMSHPERALAMHALEAKPDLFLKTVSKPFASYLNDLAHTKFVLSPRGNGLDCHRTWEALVIGCIPIVKHSLLDPVFEGLPVLIIDDWNSLTKDFLEQKWQEYATKKWQQEKKFAIYWINKIKTKLQEKVNENSIE